MVEVKLKDGFTVQVDKRRLNDWGFLKMLRQIDKGDSAVIVDAAEVMLGGEEAVDRLAKHLEVDGITPADAMVDALTELMESLNELKNS